MFNSITLYVTSECQLECRLCAARAWAEAAGPYQMSLEELQEFIGVCQASRYHFVEVKLTVREPLLWKNLGPGCRMLAESGICDHLALLSNAWAFTPAREAEIVEALRPVDQLWVSQYQGNEHRVAAMVARLPRTKILGVGLHARQPRGPVPNSLPADCSCRGFGLFRSMVTLCPAIPNLYATLGRDSSLYPSYCKPLKVGCMDNFDVAARHLQEHCQHCLGNVLVMRAMPLEPTRVPGPSANPEML